MQRMMGSWRSRPRNCRRWRRGRAGLQPAWPAIRKFIVTKPLGAIGGAVILLMVLTAIFADVLAPYDPYEISQRLQFKPPSQRTGWGPTNLAETCSHV